MSIVLILDWQYYLYTIYAEDNFHILNSIMCVLSSFISNMAFLLKHQWIEYTTLLLRLIRCRLS
jgi:hypothetical protein